MADLNPQQRAILRAIQAAPSWKRASKKVRKAAIETVGVESNFSSPDQAHSDRDSEGPFQQRPSQGWGPTSETATQDAEQFLSRAIRIAHQYASSGELAQAVQGSAYPERYNQRSGQAERILAGLGGSGGGSTPAGARLSLTGSAARVTPGTAPTFTPATTTTDTSGALVDTLLSRSHGHKGGGLLQALDARIAGGGYTTTTPSKITDGTPAKVTGGGNHLTAIEGGGEGGGLADSATARANAIDAKHMPYLWGGGHGQRIIHAADATPLDCSGAVSAVLGINPRVAAQFEGWGSPGDGGSKGVTVYAKDSHVLMKINGHFFGTSGSNPGGGAGWIPAGKLSKAYLAGFTARHSAAA